MPAETVAIDLHKHQREALAHIQAKIAAQQAPFYIEWPSKAEVACFKQEHGV